MTAAVTLLLLVGCGRVGFDDVDGRSEELAPDAAVSPAVVGGCWASWRAGAPNVSAPRRLDELVNGAARLANPSFAGTERLYYTTNANGYDVLTTTRSVPDGPWSSGTALVEVNTPDEEGRISLSDDGLLAVFLRVVGAQHDLVEATRANAAEPFAPGTTTPFAAFPYSSTTFDPELIGNGRRIYFSQNDTIFTASRLAVTSSFGVPTPVPLDYPQVGDPALSPDELVIVFSDNQNPMRELYFATRASRDDDFGPAQPVPVVNTTADEGDADLSPDGCELVFSSNRDITSNNRQIWSSLVE